MYLTINNFNYIYNLLNLLNVTCFASIPFIHNYIPIQYYNSINNYLMFYFFINSFKNYNNVPILLHHSMYTFLIYKLNDFKIINYFLILDISTIFLLIIKTFKANNLKPLFIFSWISLRFVYFPLLIYYILNIYTFLPINDLNYINKILVFILSIISNNLHLYWTIILVDNTLDFKYAISSNFLHIVPVSFCLYYNCLTFEKFIISFYMYLISSIHHILFNDNNNNNNNNNTSKIYYKYILSLDTTIISYIALMYINNNNIYYTNYLLCIINSFIKFKFKKSKIHILLTSITIIKLILNNNSTIILLQPGILAFINNIINNKFKYQDLFLWHSSVSYAVANTFILN